MASISIKYTTIFVPEGGKCYFKHGSVSEEIQRDSLSSGEHSFYANNENRQHKMFIIVWPDYTTDIRGWDSDFYRDVEVYVLTKDELTIKDIIE